MNDYNLINRANVKIAHSYNDLKVSDKQKKFIESFLGECAIQFRKYTEDVKEYITSDCQASIDDLLNKHNDSR